jgi:hypothetical protein
MKTNYSNNSSDTNSKDHFAEIIESCLDHYLAQSWEWNFFPRFGSLVQVETKETTVFGVVCHTQTGSMDPMRYPFPYKKTEEELLREQPQIFEFLKTIFKVQIVGYSENQSKNSIYYMLPPTPCKIHAFVKSAPLNITKDFFSNPDYLHLIFSFANQIPNLDELLVAILNNLAKQKILDAKKIDSFCQAFSLLTGNDYRRLKTFLRRIENI